jgi:thiol-disulfide isomerase/thioredoxin
MNKLIFTAVFILSSIACLAQKDSVLAPPYQRFPTVPPFKLLQVDSSSYFTKTDLKKKKPVLIILFDPACEHCQHETEEIIKNMNDFKKIEIVMATNASFEMLKDFYKKYDLGRYENIHPGLDVQTILAPFFMIHNLPYLAMYDKKGNLLTTFEGTMKIEKIIDIFK